MATVYCIFLPEANDGWGMTNPKGVIVAKKRTTAAMAAGVIAVMALSACGGGSQGDSTGSSEAPAESQAGGTVHVLNSTTVETWDPQRNTESAAYNFAIRTFWRSLTTAEPGTGKMVGDLATDAGTVSDDGKTWTFDIRDDAFWQDGEPVTCDDVKYGISRSFAIDQITGGSTYAMRFLDIPKDGEGASLYKGPYSGEGSEHYDKAVTCDANTIAFHLAKPQFDFHLTLSTSGFMAYRKDQDQGAKSLHTVFSAGPYMIKDEWKSGAGGTFVRNPYWKASDHDVRLGLPDEIVFEEGLSEDAPIQRIIANSGKDAAAVTLVPATPAQQPLIMMDQKLMDRTLIASRSGIDFLQPNYRSETMSDPVIRQALAVSTNRSGYAQALGGEELFPPSYSVLYPGLEASSDEPPFGEPLTGDSEKAKSLLESAKVSLPVKIEVAYKKSSTSDKAMAALAEGWKAAGFDVKLQGIADNYYSVAASPASADKYDVFWNTWGISWPSAGTVVPNLFDSRINLSEAGTRLDYGYFDNAELNATMDEAAFIVDDSEREQAWGAVSLAIARDGGYIALAGQTALLPYGSSIDLGSAGESVPGTIEIDFAEISVK